MHYAPGRQPVCGNKNVTARYETSDNLTREPAKPQRLNLTSTTFTRTNLLYRRMRVCQCRPLADAVTGLYWQSGSLGLSAYATSLGSLTLSL